MECVDLKQKFGHKFRVFCEESWKHEKNNQRKERPWSYELRGRYGIIYPRNKTEVVIYTSGVKTRKKLKRMKLQVLQWGEEEATFALLVDKVIPLWIDKLLLLYTKRNISYEHKAKLNSGLELWKRNSAAQTHL